MNKNSENPKVGAQFQRNVALWLERNLRKEFVLEKPIEIGNPSKAHKFDIVDADGTMAVECKCYTWTEGGNVPSAKIGTANEAAFYLSFLPEHYTKMIVLLRTYQDKRNETLAEYYFRTNRHLLGNIIVAEYDPEVDDLKIVRESNTVSKRYEYIEEETDSYENSMKLLWYNGSEAAWKRALNHYFELLSREQLILENELNTLCAEGIENMDAEAFYDFLYNKYFVWKYTAKNRLATTRMNLQKYIANADLWRLHEIKTRMLCANKSDVIKCLDIVTEIHGLGTAGASGLLSRLFPEHFGTVDQFVVKSLCKVDDPRYMDSLTKMNPEILNNKDGAILEKILREKAKALNAKFNTDFWTPRKLDMVLWSFGR